MTQDFKITVKSMEHSDTYRRWTVSFVTRSMFIGTNIIEVHIEDSDPSPRGDDMPRSPEDILARARRRVAIGFGILAGIADDAVEDIFKEAVKAEVLSAVQAARIPIERDDAEPSNE